MSNVRPDASGIRARGAEFKPSSRADDFPYDKPIRGYADKPVWEAIEEILGSPILLKKAYSSQGGSSVPGGNSSSTWGRMPAHSWDRSPMDTEFDPNPPPVESVPCPLTTHDQTDDSLETKIDRIYGRDNNVEFEILPPMSHDDTVATYGLVQTSEPIDLVGGDDVIDLGLHPEKSVWPFLEKALMTMKF